MKMICDVPDEVIKCIKDGTWCGSSVAEKMIANGIPLSSSEEPCEDAISRQAVLDVIEKAVTKEVARWSIKELPSVNPQKAICPSAGVDCEDCPAYEDAISRKAVLDTLERMDKALDEDRTVENYKDLLRECYKVLPKSEWQHDHEILKAYSDGASAMLDKIRAEIEQYEHYLELLDADMKDGSATIVTKTKYAVYTEVVKQLKEVEVQE